MGRHADQILYEMLAEICAAMGHPVRIRIIDQLALKESTCSDLLKTIDIPKANLSQHMAVLKKAGLVTVRREGLFHHHSLAIPEITDACAMVKQVLAERADKEAKKTSRLRKSLARR